MSKAQKAQLNTYTVGAHVHVWCDTEIKAESLEQAAQLAQNLDIEDFVHCKAGGCNEGRLKIIQVFNADSEL